MKKLLFAILITLVAGSTFGAAGDYSFYLRAQSADYDSVVWVRKIAGASSETYIDSGQLVGNDSVLLTYNYDTSYVVIFDWYPLATAAPVTSEVFYPANPRVWGPDIAATLKSLTVANADGDAVNLSSSNATGNALEMTTSSGGHAVYIGGSGTGRGVSISGGSGGGIGVSIAGTGGESGLSIQGNGAGAGLLVVGGATGAGIYASGGASSGDGIQAVGVATGRGLNIDGDAGPGVSINGGSNGLTVEATSGDVIIVSAAGNGDALRLSGAGTGKDILLDGSGTISDGTNDVLMTNDSALLANRGEIAGEVADSTSVAATDTTSIKAMINNNITSAISGAGWANIFSDTIWHEGTRSLTELDEDNTTIDLNGSSVLMHFNNITGTLDASEVGETFWAEIAARADSGATVSVDSTTVAQAAYDAGAALIADSSLSGGCSGDGAYTVTIYAIDTSGTDEAVSNVYLSVSNTAASETWMQETGSGGYKAFSLDADSFIVNPTRSGFIFGVDTIVVSAAATDSVFGYNLTVPTATDPSYTKVQGNLRSPAGEYYAGAIITVTRAGAQAADTLNNLIVSNWVADVRANDTGYFSVDLLPTTSYSDTLNGFYYMKITYGGNPIYENQKLRVGASTIDISDLVN